MPSDVQLSQAVTEQCHIPSAPVSQCPSPFLQPGDSVDGGWYTIQQKIGTGAFGVVYHAIDRAGYSFAIKTLLPKESRPNEAQGKKSSRRLPKRTIFQRFTDEAITHTAVNDHPSIVTLHRTFIENGRYHFVFDLYCGGTLLNAIIEQGLYWNDDEAITKAFIQLIDAVAHCHLHGVAHRDLKPDNILLSHDGRSCFLADFGLATTERNCGKFGTGSKHYKSPECIGAELTSKSYDTHASDVWSLGVILVNMITGSHPWTRAHTSDPNFAAYICSRDHLANALPLHPRATDLLKRVFEPDATRRITLPELRAQAEDIGHWGLNHAELAFASDAARASVLCYARTLNTHYVLPPAVHIELQQYRSSVRRERPIPLVILRQNAHLPSKASMFAPETRARERAPLSSGARTGRA